MRYKFLILMVCFISFQPLYSRAQAPEVEYETWVSCDVVETEILARGVYPGSYLVSYWADGDSLLSYPFSDGEDERYFGPWHSYTTPGNYVVQHIWYDSGGAEILTVHDTIAIGCISLTGTHYKDIDSDCSMDFDESALGVMVGLELQKDGVPIDTIFTYSTSYFLPIDMPDYTATYRLRPLPMYGYTLTCPAIGYYDISLSSILSGDYFDFAYECNPVESGMQFSVLLSSFMRAVDTSYLYLDACNGACTSADAKLHLTLDSLYEYAGMSVGATPSSVSADGRTITWNLPSLENCEYLWVKAVPVTTDIEVGDSTCSELKITAWDGTYGTDSYIDDNEYVYCSRVRGSFDPNFKSVQPQDAIAAGELLTYNIQFENLGNDTAFNIFIIDTLSLNVDVSSFRVLHATHPLNVMTIQQGGYTIVKFDFPRIKLPDVTSPQYNKGSVSYSVMAKETMAVGDEVKNTAYIYFDINPAVVTNTVTNFIPNPSSIQEVQKSDGLLVYPNPASEQVTIKNESGTFDQVSIVAADGRVHQAYRIGRGSNSIGLKGMVPGVYYLIISGEGQTRSSRLVVR